jgi:hypothetical protein
MSPIKEIRYLRAIIAMVSMIGMIYNYLDRIRDEAQRLQKMVTDDHQINLFEE